MANPSEQESYQKMACGCGWSHTPPDIMQQTMDKLAHAEACIKARDERIRRLEEELSMIGQVVRDSLKHVCVMANE